MFSTSQVILIIALSALATFACRALPFALFGRKKEVPPMVKRLGDALPYAVIASLVVYCLKDLFVGAGELVNFTNLFGAGDAANAAQTAQLMEMLYLLASVAVVVVVHLWKKNTILSIAIGTFVYMILLHL